MANMCWTDYTFTGNKESLEDFRSTLVSTRKEDEDSGRLLPLGLSSILAAFDFEPDNFVCRGTVEYIEDVCDDTDGESPYLKLSTSTAWVPLPEIWDAILSERYPDLHYVMCAEEEGFDLYVNTDKSFKHFDVGYKVVINEDEEIYVGGGDSAVKELNEIFGWKCKSMKQFESRLQRKKECMERNGKNFSFKVCKYKDTWKASM